MSGYYHPYWSHKDFFPKWFCCVIKEADKPCRCCKKITCCCECKASCSCHKQCRCQCKASCSCHKQSRCECKASCDCHKRCSCQCKARSSCQKHVKGSCQCKETSGCQKKTHLHTWNTCHCQWKKCHCEKQGPICHCHWKEKHGHCFHGQKNQCIKKESGINAHSQWHCWICGNPIHHDWWDDDE